jgi:hypothetical protein
MGGDVPLQAFSGGNARLVGGGNAAADAAHLQSLTPAQQHQLQQLVSLGYGSDTTLLQTLGLLPSPQGRSAAAHSPAFGAAGMDHHQQQRLGAGAATSPQREPPSPAQVVASSTALLMPQPGGPLPASIAAASQLGAMAASSAPSEREVAAARDAQRDAARTAKVVLERSAGHERKDIFLIARGKANACRDGEEALRRRLAALPRETEALRGRMVAALGPSAAEERLAAVARVGRRTAERQASNALLRMGEADTSLLQAFMEGQSLPVRATRDDLRGCRAALEGAIAEEHKQGVEMQLNTAVLHNCVEQARRMCEGGEWCSVGACRAQCAGAPGRRWAECRGQLRGVKGFCAVLCWRVARRHAVPSTLLM